jgi:hypothetical protein
MDWGEVMKGVLSMCENFRKSQGRATGLIKALGPSKDIK